MQIHVARDGKELGSFYLDEVRAGLTSGKFLPTDFAWTEGQADWVRLPALPGLVPVTPTPAPQSEPAPAAAPPPPVAEPLVPESQDGLSSPVRSLPASTRFAPARTSTLASASLLLGVLSLSAVPLLPAIPAIVCGHLARWRIRGSEGALVGDGLALGGLITGYLSLFLFGLIGALIFAIATGVGPTLPVAIPIVPE